MLERIHVVVDVGESYVDPSKFIEYTALAEKCGIPIAWLKNYNLLSILTS